MKFSRARIGSAVAALAFATSLIGSAPVQAAGPGFTPTPADFSKCPELPAGVRPILWNCVSITLVDSSFKIGNIPNINWADPIQFTAAVGPKDGKISTLMGGGGGHTQPGNIGSLTSVELEISLVGPIKFSFGILPTDIPIMLELTNPLINTCDIGSSTAPIHLGPKITNPGLKWLDDKPVINATIAENTFNIPTVTNCGPLNLYGALVNGILGLPSPSGNNALNTTSYIQVKNYVMGNITQKAAATLE